MKAEEDDKNFAVSNALRRNSVDIWAKTGVDGRRVSYAQMSLPPTSGRHLHLDELLASESHATDMGVRNKPKPLFLTPRTEGAFNVSQWAFRGVLGLWYPDS